jgi:hypothetical protein
MIVNFDRIKDIILGTDAPDVITVHTESKIKRKMRKGDGSCPSSADTVFIMLSRLDDFESAPFDDTKDEQTSSVRVS